MKRIMHFVAVLAVFLFVNNLSVKAVEYYVDQNLHLSFSLYPETHEAYVGNEVDNEGSAIGYPPINDPWWDNQTNLWENIVVPSTLQVNDVQYVVVGVASNAFSRRTGIKTVTLPETVKSIGSKAFYFCVNLKSVNIPEGVVAINSQTFELCRELEGIDIPSSVTSIGNRAFVDCHSITHITIPAACTSIGDEAFVWCTSLKEVIFEDGDTPLNLGCSYALSLEWEYGDDSGYGKAHYRGLFADSPIKSFHLGRNVTIPTVLGKTYPPFKCFINYHGYEVWAQNTFHIDTVTLGEHLSTLPDEIFSYVEIGNSLVLPDSVVSIGERAFDHATIDGELTLPASCSVIGDYAFSEVSGLYLLNCNQEVPPTVSEHTFYAFHGTNIVAKVPASCGSAYRNDPLWKELTIIDPADLALDIRVTTPGSLSSLLFAKVESMDEVYSLKLSGHIADADWGVIKEMSNLYSIDLYDISNDYIPSYAFSGMNIAVLKLPRYVKSIGSYAFNNCSHLNGELTIPETCHLIGERAFYGTSLKHVSCSDSVSISGWSFASSKVESIRIGGQGTVLGSHAFYNCLSLKSVVLEEGVNSLGESCFFTCDGLQSVQFNPDLQQIGEDAFYKCSSLVSVILPDSLSICGEGCFTYCTSLEKVFIPGRLSVIPSSMFYECTNLRTVNIPEGVTEIGEKVFMNCDYIKKIELPSTLKTIGNYAFSCDSITEVDIPESVTSYKVNSFTYKVKTFRVHWDTPINMNTTNYYKNTTLYVPIGTSSKYLNDKYFKVFTIKEEGEIDLEVNGGGQVKMDGVSATSGISHFYFTPYKSLNFSIVPDSGNIIQSVFINGRNIVDDITAEGEYVIAEANVNYTISVEFSEMYVPDTAFCSLSICDTSFRRPQENMVVPLILDNKVTVCGFECWLELPEGFSIQRNYNQQAGDSTWNISKGERMGSGHNIYCSKQEDGLYHILSIDLTSNEDYLDDSAKKELPVAYITLSVDGEKAVGYHTLILHDILFNHNEIDSIHEYSVRYASSEIYIMNKKAVQVQASNQSLGDVGIEGYTYNSEYNDADLNDWMTFSAFPAENCHFVKWMNGEEVVSTDNPMIVELTDDVCYTAVFETDKYVAMFLDYDGSVISKQSVPYNSVITLPGNPEREGYLFIGWSPEVDSVMPGHDVTYQAVYLQQGDVTCDGKINLTDLTILVNYILQDITPAPQIFLVADANADSKLDIADLTLIVNMIMGNDAQSVASISNDEIVASELLNVKANAKGKDQVVLSVDLSGFDKKFSGIQFDLSLPDGAVIDSMHTDCMNHTISYNQLPDGSNRVMLYSFENHNFSSEGGKLIEMYLHVDGQENSIELTFDNTVIVNPMAEVWSPGLQTLQVHINSATELPVIKEDSEQPAIFNLQGQRQELPVRGIMIIDRKKVQIR